MTGCQVGKPASAMTVKTTSAKNSGVSTAIANRKANSPTKIAPTTPNSKTIWTTSLWACSQRNSSALV